MRLLAMLLLAALPAAAETPLSPSEFETYTTGKTLTYSAGGIPFGIEEYLPDRRVRWSYLDGQCEDGEWYPAGDMICFVYEADHVADLGRHSLRHRGIPPRPPRALVLSGRPVRGRGMVSGRRHDLLRLRGRSCRRSRAAFPSASRNTSPTAACAGPIWTASARTGNGIRPAT